MKETENWNFKVEFDIQLSHYDWKGVKNKITKYNYHVKNRIWFWSTIPQYLRESEKCVHVVLLCLHTEAERERERERTNSPTADR